MPLVDLRQIGKITAIDESFLASLIANACGRSRSKHRTSITAKSDFGWSNELLLIYDLAGYITDGSSRAVGHISSGEWLCGILTSGEVLERDHLLIVMSYVNPKESIKNAIRGKYKSGQKYWRHGPPTIKRLLDLLDNALIAEETVLVKIPKIIPLDETKTLQDLEEMSVDKVREEIRVDWN